MIRRSWRTQLKAASTDRDVLAVVRGFMSEWSAAEIAALPPGAWPSRIATTEDVVSHSVVLAGLHARFRDAAEQLQMLQEMVLFFTQAAVRAVGIREATAEADCPPRRTRKVAAEMRMKPRHGAPRKPASSRTRRKSAR